MVLFKSAARARAEHTVPVADGQHALCVREYGAAEGVPIVYLHGGPGGGTPPDVHRLFDPEVFRVILFDQRGCGRSSCEDRLRDNTTGHLLGDIEAVRTALGIERWAVMGSSYGSLLAALYAARHAARVRWVILHGVFLGSAGEIAWLYTSNGAARFYPQQWVDFEASAETAAANGGLENDSEGSAPLGATATGSSCIASTSDARTATAAPAAIAPPVDTPPPLLTAYYNLLTMPTVPREHSPSSDAQPIPGAALAAAAALAKWEDEMETLSPCPATHDAAELLACKLACVL